MKGEVWGMRVWRWLPPAALAVLLALPVPAVAGAAAAPAMVGDLVIPAGEVRDRVELQAGSLVVDGEVTGPVAVGAGEVTVRGRTGPLRLGAGEVRLDGRSGPVEVGMGQVEVRGEVDGSIRLGLGQVRLLPGARVRGAVTVGFGQVERAAGSQVEGEVRTGAGVPWGALGALGRLPSGYRHEVRPLIGPYLHISPYLHLVQWAGLFLLAALTLALAPGVVERLTAHLAAHPGRVLLSGLLVVAATPLVVLLLVVSLVGILAIPVLLLALAVGKFLGYVAVSAWVGAALARLVPALQGNHGTAFWRLLAGSLALALARLVPLAGWVVAAGGGLLGLGAAALLLWEWVQARRG